jgi:hypothetical protein
MSTGRTICRQDTCYGRTGEKEDNVREWANPEHRVFRRGRRELSTLRSILAELRV